MQKILIVDNSSDLLTLFTYIFKTEPIEIECCEDKEVMLVKLQSYIPDLMIIDVMRSGVDEKIILEDIRNKNLLRSIPIIITSTKKEHINNYRSFHANDAVEKPFNMNDVKQKVRSFLPALK